MTKDTIHIGVISDTHNLLRPEARIALAGSDHIIHAGDICGPQVLEELGRIAPVTAVRGNNDRGTWADELRERETIVIGGVTLHIVHDMGDLDVDAHAEGIGVVITGHSHKPSIKMESGVLYLNPGSAGPRRFKLPISLAFLEIREGQRAARIQTLEVD
jgi:hypothetical protein